jgi:hypothetical protein
VRLTLFLLIVFSFPALAQNTFPALGMWREHAPYQSAIDVTASDNKIYVATPYNLFSVDRSTKEIERISKVSGLSETGISVIKFDPISKKLIIAYANSNIDVIDKEGIHNVPGLKRANVPGDKNVYHIFTDNNLAYLSTGLGVIVLDEQKMEIRSSWFIGNNGDYVKTNGFTKDAIFFYAATEEGLKKIAVSNNNPSNFSNWQNISGINGLPAGPVKAVVNFQNRIIAMVNDSLYVQNGITWNFFYGDGWPINFINISEDRLLAGERKSTGESRVLVLSSLAVAEKIIVQNGVIGFPKNAIRLNNEYWIADMFGGLSHWIGNDFTRYQPNSPENVLIGEMVAANNMLYATAGSVNDAWNYQYNRSGVFQFTDGTWYPYNQYRFSQLDTLLDFITVAIDPRDESVWAGSFGGGLLHIEKSGQLKIYKQNSSLLPSVGDPGSYRVSGLAFDNNNNLWVSNFASPKPLHVLKADGNWVSFAIPFSLNEGAVSQVLTDDANQVWIVSPKNNGLIVFNHNNTLDNPADDQWRMYRMGAGAGNLPSNEVTSIAMDKSGFIWVGTIDGIGVIQCPLDIMTAGCEAVLPTIKEGGFVNYLFKGEAVRSIAVDGADQKWVATANGVWLVNAEGNKVLNYFNETNSPLLSSDVKSIAINGKTGEVFFGTAKGVSSYRGMATEAEEDKGNVMAFPNPVPPGFSGTIAIKGLPANAVIKIIETNGRLVYQSRSLGGQATWNGRDYRGNIAAPGVYIVMAVNDDHSEKAVAKIVFIGK